MTAHNSALPRFSSFAGLQNAADAAGFAFVGPAESDDSAARTEKDWLTPVLIAGATALAVTAAGALLFILG